jgi:hypothetical protein
VLFGGFGTMGALADTWLFMGAYWSHLTPHTSPPARSFATMAYDASTAQLVLFGGQGPTCCPACAMSVSSGGRTSPRLCICPLAAVTCFGDLSDTWVWSGNNWVQLHPKASPSARSRAVMTYDPSTGKVVLFGGQNPNCCPVCARPVVCIVCGPKIKNCPNGPRSDTWSWNGSNWVLLKPATSPPARSSAVMAADLPIHRLVLFGGLGFFGKNLGDTWSWNGHTWRLVS